MSQVTAADVGPLIQHCPPVLTAILVFRAAHRNAVHGVKAGEVKQGARAGGLQFSTQCTKDCLQWKPLNFKCCGSRKHDACKVVENGGGVG